MGVEPTKSATPREAGRSKPCMVRVSRTTLELLQKEAELLARAAERGAAIGCDYDADPVGQVGIRVIMDAVIRRLLKYRQAQRDRVRKSRAKKGGDA